MLPQTLWKRQEKPPHLDVVDFRSKSPTALSPTKRDSESKGAISCWTSGFKIRDVSKGLSFLDQLMDLSWRKALGIIFFETHQFLRQFESSGGFNCEASLLSRTKSGSMTSNRLPEAIFRLRDHNMIRVEASLPIEAAKIGGWTDFQHFRCSCPSLLEHKQKTTSACWREGVELGENGVFSWCHTNDFKPQRKIVTPLFAKGSDHFPHHTLLEEGLFTPRCYS